MNQEHRKSWGGLGVGIFLVAVGIFLLFGNFHSWMIGSVWHLWPIIFLIIGLGKLIDSQNVWELRKAIWFLFLGGWFLISELHLWGFSYGNSWPILLIGVGINMVWKSYCRRPEVYFYKEVHHD